MAGRGTMTATEPSGPVLDLVRAPAPGRLGPWRRTCATEELMKSGEFCRLFEPVIVGLAVGLAAVVLPLAARADDIACVQEQLTKLGYDAGAADGKLRAQTRTAAASAKADF